MKHITKLFTASLAVVVVMGQSVLGAMQDQDKIIAKAICEEKENKGKNEEVEALHLELRQEKGTGLITDVGLGKVAVHMDLKRLKRLFLSGTKITDEGLGHVAKLKKLEILTLVGCDKITDAGLQHLHKLTNLKQVRLRGTTVSAEGIAKLKKALPNWKKIPNDFGK